MSDRLKHSAANSRHLLVSILILAAAAVVIVGLFHMLYGSAKQNLLTVWQNNVIQMARSTEYYLARPEDAVEFTAVQVEGMMEQGQSNQEIGAFLVREMEVYASLVDSNHTGVYGYCRGEYLDASGWVPAADYVPTERPWYLAAKEAKGKLAYVEPYLNLQTNEMMMSVSKLLSDGESVVSMDIFLDGMQKMAEDMVINDSVKAALILDRNGFVVSHSDPQEVGRNYLLDGGPYEKDLVRCVFAAEGGSLPLEGPRGREIVYSEPINSDWDAVLILYEQNMLRSIQFYNVWLILVLCLALLSWLGITWSFHRKHREAEQLTREVNAVADIYEAMYLIDLKTDRMKRLRSNAYLDGLLEGELAGYSSRILPITEKLSSDQARGLLVPFMDPATYGERMRNVRSVSHDFLDSRGLWTRIQLIVVDREADGSPRHIIWALESIHEDRRQQELLRKLAETDAMSGVRNRSSGETIVRQRLAEGAKGLFLLLDIDDFKSVNDSFGHDVGDLVIIAVADSLREAFRESDIVFRLGGDEFAVFVPDVDTTEAGDRIVKRLLDEIDRISIPALRERTITVSVGTAYCPGGGGDTFEALYQRADQEMYAQKRQKEGAGRRGRRPVTE